MPRPILGRTPTAYFVALLAALFLAGVFIMGQLERSLLDFISEFLSPTIAAVAVVSAVLTVAKIGVRRNDRLSIIWFSFMAGVGLWFLSEVVGAIYAPILGIPLPIPSLADVFELAGYAPILIGLGLQVWPFRDALRMKNTLIAIIMVLAGGVLALAGLTQVVAPSGIGFWGLIVSYAYPVLDIVTLMIGVPILLVFRRGTFWKPFLFLALGLIFALFADLLFAWAASNGTYYPGHPIDLLVDLGFLSAALGFYLMRKKTVERSL